METAFVGATVIDGKDGEARDGMAVVIDGETITRVVEASAIPQDVSVLADEARLELVIKSGTTLVGLGTAVKGGCANHSGTPTGGIYICAPITSGKGTGGGVTAGGAIVGSIGIYGESGQLDTVTVIRALSAVSEVLGAGVLRANEASPQQTPGHQDENRYDRARLRIHILGPLRVELDGVDVTLGTFRRSRSISSCPRRVWLAWTPLTWSGWTPRRWIAR